MNSSNDFTPDSDVDELALTSGRFRSLEQFRVEKRIGRGQFSEVYRAVCVEDNMPVAIKKVHFYDMVDAAARIDCLKEINLLQVNN